MHKLKFLASVAALAVAVPAYAQDGTVPAARFAGARAELRVGLDIVDVEASVTNGATIVSGSDDETGFAIGGELGYDFAVTPNVTLGAYAGLDYTTTEFCDGAPGSTGCLDIGRNITLGVRAGVAASDRVLVYAKGGYSNGQFDFAIQNGASVFTTGDDRDGFHLGAGAQFAFGRNTYASLEYVYSDYGSFNFTQAGVGAVSVDTSRHQILAGIGVRF